MSMEKFSILMKIWGYEFMLLFHVCVEAPYWCSFILLVLACNRLSHLVSELVHSFFCHWHQSGFPCFWIFFIVGHSMLWSLKSALSISLPSKNRPEMQQIAKIASRLLSTHIYRNWDINVCSCGQTLARGQLVDKVLALLPKQDLDKDNQQLTMQTSAIEATVHVDGHLSCSQVDLLIAGTFFSSVSLSVYLRLFLRSHHFSALMTFILSTAILFSARAHHVCMQSTVLRFIVRSFTAECDSLYAAFNLQFWL